MNETFDQFFDGWKVEKSTRSEAKYFTTYVGGVEVRVRVSFHFAVHDRSAADYDICWCSEWSSPISQKTLPAGWSLFRGTGRLESAVIDGATESDVIARLRDLLNSRVTRRRNRAGD